MLAPSDMDIEKALSFTDALVFAKSGTHLSDLQQAMLRESWSWQRQSYDEIADRYGYSSTYLKHDVGPKLWKLLSQVLEEKVNKTSFRAAIERRFQTEETAIQSSKTGEPAPPAHHIPLQVSTSAIANQTTSGGLQQSLQQDWGEAVDVSFFYGREPELAQLQQWLLAERCRLITLLGMGGMGKTCLSVKLAQQVQGQFEWVIWRSLRNAPLLPELLAGLLQAFDPQETLQEKEYPSTITAKFLRLLHQLRSHRCLLILDNVETVLTDNYPSDSSVQATDRRPGTYRAGYEGYGELFRQIGETLHQSCLVLTSREKPPESSLLEGAMLPVRTLQLGGLNQAEAQKLFALKGEFQASAAEWQTLVQGYSGNPLALKIISTTIQTLFDGNLSDFLNQNTLVFGTIRRLIAQQIECLSDPEKTVIYWLAIYRESASFSDLKSDIFPAIAPQKLVEILESLCQRSLIEKITPTLIEKSFVQFGLQPVVMEYITDRFVEQIGQELQTDLQPSPQKPFLLKSHALLKAEAKDYIREIQARLILKPILEQLQVDLVASESTVDTLLAKHLTSLRGKTPLEVGYAGGNILNLLCQQQTNQQQTNQQQTNHQQTYLEAYDFSQLTLWQADLQRVKLHNVDFANSDLSHSVFTETLGIVFGVAFSPDGTLLAIGDAEGGLRLWQVSTRKLLLNFEGHLGWVWSVAFSADGQTLASCSSDKTIRLWEVHTGQCLRTLSGHTSSVWSVTFSADGQTLASGGDEPIARLWDINTGECRQELSGHTGRILSVAFSADGQTLASGSDDCTIRLWQVRTGQCQQVCRGHTDHVWSVAYAPRGDSSNGSGDRANEMTLVSGSADRTIRLWSTRTGQCLNILKDHHDRVRSVKLSPNAQTLVSGSDDKTVRIWDTQTGQCLTILRGHTNSVFSVSFNADGQSIASGSTDQTVRLWNINSGRCLKTLQGYTNSVFSVAFSADGQSIASGSTDQTVRIWDINSGKCYKTLLGHEGWVTAVAFHPSGDRVASSSVDQTVRIWDVQSGQCFQVLQDHTNWVQSVAFSADGEYLASGGDDRILRLWSPNTGKCLNRLQGHSSWIWAITFSPDGQTIASSSEDHTIRLWSVSTGKCLRVLQGHTSRVKAIAFNPAGQILSSASDDETVRLWSIATGACLKILTGHNNNVWSVAFSPDGQILASGSLDQTLKLWDSHSGACLKTLPVLAHSVRSSIAFKPQPVSARSTIANPSHYALASGTHNGTIMIWDTQTGQCLKTLVPDRPYQGSNIRGVTGITTAQKAALKALGAIER